MSELTLWLLIEVFVGVPFVLWVYRRLDLGQLSHTYDSAPPEEPCWTEQVRRADGLSYGHYGCYHANLAEMEKRARLGEFDTPV